MSEKTVLSYDPQLIAAGAQKYQLGTGWCWYKKVDGQYDQSHVDVEVIDTACSYSMDSTDPFMIDIEAFDLIANHDYAVEQMTLAAQRWRTNQPDRQLGFYASVPQRDYWSPVTASFERDRGNCVRYGKARSEVIRWQDQNTRNAAALLPCVDVLFPCVYEFYVGRSREWREYAEANIEEALRVAGGKPVYPVLMPSRHPGNVEALQPADWALQVQFCWAFPDVAGVCIYSDEPNMVVHPAWRDPVIEVMKRNI